ncbi:MAG: thioesterase family protein [Alphaproteobacteria bacterium]|nr:thioesterase family protein [Alphaproteobacteria bacterium]
MFHDVHHLSPTAPGRFHGSADPTWSQGPGLFGGLVAAFLAEAVEATVDAPERRLRSLTLQLAAPVRPGRVDVEVDVVRQGSKATLLTARVLTDGVPCVHALATCAADRAGPSLDTVPMPPLPDVDAMRRLDLAGAQAPAFTRHLDYRFGIGDLPYRGAARGELGGWVRFADGARPTAPTVAALLDAWPPAVVVAIAGPAIATTMELTLDFLAPPPAVADDAPWCFHGLTTWAGNGYAEEVGALWTVDGTPVGRMRQLRAVLR